MTVATFKRSDLTKTSADTIRIRQDQSDSSESVYAFNPFVNTFVEIDPGQAWFWEASWLAEELKAEKELSRGDYEEFDNIDDFIDSM